VSNQRADRKAKTPKHSADSRPARRAKSRPKKKPKSLWQLGVLVHMTTRYPRNPKAPRIDRLLGILRNGLVAPACCQDGSVLSDLHLMVTGCDVPYDSLVFLHRFGAMSYIYTICDPGRFAVFVDPALPVLTPEAMGPNWALLCQDEVYVRERIAPEKLTGIAIHPADADSVLGDLMAEFHHRKIPLYDYDGNVLWSPE
jgi:hypothetical protein